MSKNCCKNKTAHFKVKDNQESGNLLKAPAPTSKISVFVLPVFDYNFTTSNLDKLVFNYHAPPVLYDNPLYLKHKVLLI